MWQRQVPYSEEHHLATMARQALRHPEKKSLDKHHRKSGSPFVLAMRLAVAKLEAGTRVEAAR